MPQTIVAVFDNVRDARAAQLALVAAGISEDRVTMSADLTQDALAAEAPGQSYENQPGQSPEDSAAASYSEAIRSGVCALSVKTTGQADGKRIERVMRERGARRIHGYRDSDEPPEPHGGNNTSPDDRSTPARGDTTAVDTTAPVQAGTPSIPSRRDATEQSRIAFLVERDGENAARAWVERTLKLYRDAIVTRSHAANPDYRPLFEDSIRVFEEWLRERRAPA